MRARFLAVLQKALSMIVNCHMPKNTPDAHCPSTGQEACLAKFLNGLRVLHRRIAAQMPDRVVYEGQTMGLAVLAMPPSNAASPGSCRW